MPPQDPTTLYGRAFVKQRAMFCTHCPRTVNNADLSYFYPVSNRRLTGQVIGNPGLSRRTVLRR
jgi:hypothetical protein